MEDSDIAVVAAILMSSIMRGKDIDFPAHARQAVMAARILIKELNSAPQT